VEGFLVESFAWCVRFHGSTPQSPAVTAPLKGSLNVKEPPL
jgi:hypothetical protein